jgi:FkbM family methyltransferase
MGNAYSFKFPFEKCRGANVVIYGAGQVGREYVEQIQLQREMGCKLLYIVDKGHESIRELEGVEVCPPEKLQLDDGYDFVVIASCLYADSMYITLNSLKVPSEKVVTVFPAGKNRFASWGEDVVIQTIFKLLGKEKFSYIDVGANDPYRASNTAYLYTNGCRGACVEANIDLIDELKRERPEDIVLNVGVAPEAGMMTYYMFENNIYNTLSDVIAAQSTSALVGTRCVPVVTLDSIIEEHFGGVYPEFLQIDVEGLDYDILNTCDFGENPPLVICAEAGEWNMDAMNRMLEVKGFCPFHQTPANIIYLQNGIREKCLDIWKGSE